MDRQTIRARVRDLLIEQGTDLYSNANIDNWIDISYTYFALLAAELDRSYFLVSTPGVSYAADTFDISISAVAGDATGTTTPSTPFRIIAVDDTTDGATPDLIRKVYPGPHEARLTTADYIFWVYTGPLRIGLRNIPGSARTLRIWWQNNPTSLAADATVPALPVAVHPAIIYDTALNILSSEEGYVESVAQLRQDWHDRFVNHVRIRQSDEPASMTSGGADYGG